MLNKETKKKLKELGFNVDDLIAAVTHAEEQSFDFPEINNYTEADLASRDENIKKSAFKDGKKTGIELAVKNVAKKLGLDETITEPDALSDAIGKSGAKSDNEQITLLQKRAERAEQERDAAVSSEKLAKRDAELLSSFPVNRKTELSDAEYLGLFKMGYEITDDGIKRNGTILRDEKTQNPLSLKDAINNMFTERGFIGGQQQQQGRGDGDKPNGNKGIKTYSAAEAQWVKDNPDKSQMTGEFQAYIANLAKEPGFNINA